MTCIYGCQKDGTPCPRPHTCRTIGLIKKQQDECCTGNCRQGRDCTRASYGMLDVVKDVVLVLVLVLVVVVKDVVLVLVLVLVVVAIVALFSDWLAHKLIRG